MKVIIEINIIEKFETKTCSTDQGMITEEVCAEASAEFNEIKLADLTDKEFRELFEKEIFNQYNNR